MLIVFHGLDRPGSAELRTSTRPAHLKFQSQRRNLFGGPLLASNGSVCGTLIIFEAPDVATATGELAEDPYLQAGLFEHLSITQFAGEWPTTGGAPRANDPDLSSTG